MPTVKKMLSDNDPILAKIIVTTPAPSIVSTNNIFQDIVSCIVEQQIHYRSTKKIFQRLLDKANLQSLTLDNYDNFEKLAMPTLKLSMNKLETVHRIFTTFSESYTDWNILSDAEVREKLADIKGVGPWTIDMILLYTLQRPNIFPVDDFHIKNIMTNLYSLNATTKLKAQMLSVAESWGNHKSSAVLYLLEAKKAKTI